MSLGWIKLHRDLKEKPIWKSSTPEQKNHPCDFVNDGKSQGK
ncbi:hypothetical protein ACSDQX_04555 [Listeria monocytogenes]